LLRVAHVLHACTEMVLWTSEQCWAV
jgi:hypothetical protein